MLAIQGISNGLRHKHMFFTIYYHDHSVAWIEKESIFSNLVINLFQETDNQGQDSSKLIQYPRLDTPVNIDIHNCGRCLNMLHRRFHPNLSKKPMLLLRRKFLFRASPPRKSVQSRIHLKMYLVLTIKFHVQITGDNQDIHTVDSIKSFIERGTHISKAKSYRSQILYSFFVIWWPDLFPSLLLGANSLKNPFQKLLLYSIDLMRKFYKRSARQHNSLGNTAPSNHDLLLTYWKKRCGCYGQYFPNYWSVRLIFFYKH